MRRQDLQILAVFCDRAPGHLQSFSLEMAFNVLIGKRMGLILGIDQILDLLLNAAARSFNTAIPVRMTVSIRVAVPIGT